LATTRLPGSTGAGPGVLTREDVKALFEVFIEFVSSTKKSSRKLAFTGDALAVLLASYSEHLLGLMNDWEGLSPALRSAAAKERAAGTRARLAQRRRRAQPAIFSAALPFLLIGTAEAEWARSLIRGKGMEI
jgi:hypothetical protein